MTNTCFWLKQLKDLQVFTVARVIFQLADEIPCISAVVVALLADVHFIPLKIQNQMHFSLSSLLSDNDKLFLNQPKPRIDYTLKAVGGSLTAVPGLSDMIDVSSSLGRSSSFQRLYLFSHFL